MDPFATKRKMFEQMKAKGDELTGSDLKSRYAPEEEMEGEEPAVEEVPGVEEEGMAAEGEGAEPSLDELLADIPPELLEKLMAQVK